MTIEGQEKYHRVKEGANLNRPLRGQNRREKEVR